MQSWWNPPFSWLILSNCTLDKSKWECQSCEHCVHLSAFVTMCTFNFDWHWKVHYKVFNHKYMYYTTQYHLPPMIFAIFTCGFIIIFVFGNFIVLSLSIFPWDKLLLICLFSFKFLYKIQNNPWKPSRNDNFLNTGYITLD